MNSSFTMSLIFAIIGVSYSQSLTSSDKWSLVDLHNEYRAKIANGQINGFRSASKMPALTWNDKLAQAAQSWADKCEWGHNPSSTSFGENLHTESGLITSPGQSVGQASISEVINSGLLGWFNEYGDAYQYPDGRIVESRGGDIGHFTQMIWEETTQIGCGYTKCNNYPPGHYLVCNYYPAGNFNMDIAPVYNIGSTGNQCSNGKRSDGLCNGSGGSGTELTPQTPSPTTSSSTGGGSGSTGADAQQSYIQNICNNCYSSSTQCYPCITTVTCCNGQSKEFTD